MGDLLDEQVIERVLGGDKNLYGILVDRYAGLVYRLALNILHDCDTAEDMTQESFMIAYENLECLRNPSTFASWIAVITRNQCHKLQRKQKIAPLSLDYLGEIGIEPGDHGNSPMIDKHRATSLRKIIATLPEKYRIILDLRYVEEFSYKRVSDFLGITMSAVKSRLYHAKKEVLKRLKKEGWL
jgi:RNA polymerase sigma factor (sigma-70 family)